MSRWNETRRPEWCAKTIFLLVTKACKTYSHCPTDEGEMHSGSAQPAEFCNEQKNLLWFEAVACVELG